MNAALDALLAGRSVGEATQEVAEAISSKSSSRPPPPALVTSQAPRPSSRGVRFTRTSSRSRSSSASHSAQVPRPPRASTGGAKKAPRIAPRPVEDPELRRTKPALPSSGVSEERLEASITEDRVSEGGMEIIPAGESAQGAPVEVAPITEEKEPGPVSEVIPQGAVEGAESGLVEVVPPRGKSSTAFKGSAEGAGSKCPPPSKAMAPAPVSKKARASRRPAPPLPPLEKEKTSVVPLLSAPDNDILNAEDISHQSPASVVVEILRG
ncbi:verprolin-like [Manihot esculenta]|uniref:verprolin-like n=1 Tax=Manihot esculenta TaxID=3983 RepID=UPI000B5D3815|nr:verprolin-like [Manihot esculenta]